MTKSISNSTVTDLYERLTVLWQRRTVRVLFALGFVLAALVAYHGTLQVPLSSDARYLTYMNEYNREVGGLLKFWKSDYFAGAITHSVPANSGYYRPIANTILWFEYQLFGQRDLIYNLIEVILHGLNGFLVLLVCYRISGSLAIGGLAGLFFVLHPAHAFAAVEPAAQADVLFPLFYFLGLLSFDSALRTERAGSARWTVGLALLFYLLSVLSKEMGITLPAVLVLLVVYRHFTDGVAWDRLKWTIPAWAALAGYLVLRFGILQVEMQVVGYQEVHSPIALGIGAVKGIVVQISRLILPLGASYPELNPWLVNLVSSPLTDPLAYVALTVVLALAVIALMYRRHPYIAFWSGFFLVTYSPLLKVDSIAGTLGYNVILTEERWIYLPSVAVAALVGWAIVQLWSKLSDPIGRRVLAVAAVAGLLLLGRQAHAHAGRHEDPHARLRRLYLYPEDQLSRFERANKALLYARWVAMPLGDLEEAERRARAAYAIVPDSPISAAALGAVLAERKKWQEVVELLEPWLHPSAEYLARQKLTNFRIYDDVSRVSQIIPMLLARAHAHLGSGEQAVGLLCEAVSRQFDPGEIAEALGENWALNGPARCSEAENPELCISRVDLPPESSWRPPFEPASCVSWPARWGELLLVQDSASAVE